MKMYEYSNERYEHLIEKYNAAETPEEQEEVLQELHKIQEGRDQKARACCMWLRELMSHEEALAQEIKLLEYKHTQAEKRIEAFKTYLGLCIGEDKGWSDGVFKLNWKTTEAVQVLKSDEIPTAYMREKISYEPDKTQIKNDIKAGATIPGVELKVRKHLILK